MSYIKNDKNEMKKFSIYVDIREPKQIYDRLEQLKEFEVIRQKLDVGDYFIPADKSLLIERKTVTDYLNSIFDTRLWDELARMKESKLSDEGELIPILLVEGNWSFVFKFGKKQDKHVVGTIYASLLSTMASFGVNVISSPSIIWTPYIIANMVKWLGKPKSISPPVYKPKALTLDEVAIRVLSSFPHISVERAKKILKHYGTLKDALDNVGWWKHSIDGIGDKIVNDIKTVLEHKVKIVETKK